MNGHDNFSVIAGRPSKIPLSQVSSRLPLMIRTPTRCHSGTYQCATCLWRSKVETKFFIRICHVLAHDSVGIKRQIETKLLTHRTASQGRKHIPLSLEWRDRTTKPREGIVLFYFLSLQACSDKHPSMEAEIPLTIPIEMPMLCSRGCICVLDHVKR